MIGVLMIAALTVAPPPIVTTPSTPEPTTLSFDVTATHDAKLLWAGSLSIASRSNASFSQERNASAICMTVKGAVVVRYTSAVRIQLMPGDYSDPQSVRVSASWRRPVTIQKGGSPFCDDVSTRSVEIEGLFRVTDGKPLILTGDAGFRVELKPRTDPVFEYRP